jgi:hypothetical protein
MSGPIEADIYMNPTAADSSVIATVSDVSRSGVATTASDITSGSLVASSERSPPRRAEYGTIRGLL